ncbi:hypothetical protein KBC70_00460 [Candidatus Woesebacteria bacterium]|nr:hypothetical protein [Candidatus Woesebacteria bacterium]
MKITLYTIPDCQFCKQEKDYLTSKGLPFDEKDVMANKDFLAEMLQKSQNFAGVPFTSLEEGTQNVMLKGFTLSEFDDAIAQMSGAPMQAAQNEKPMDMHANKLPEDASTSLDMPVTPAPVDMPKPAMPSLDMSAAPAMDQPPVSPAMDQPPVSTIPSLTQTASPSMLQPVQPLNPVSSADVDLDDPQDELNSLLEDLQAKVDVAPASPAGSQTPQNIPSAPAMPSAPVMPAIPTMPTAPAMGQPAASTPPAVPDFNAGQ